MTPPTAPTLQPLRGPVGLRELFFTRASSPMLGYIKQRKPWLLVFGMAALIAYFIYDSFPVRSMRWQRDMLLVLQIFAWIGLGSDGLSSAKRTIVRHCHRCGLLFSRTL
jgi:hypothetical protein